MKDGMPQFEYTLCMACGICTQACPFDCLGLSQSHIHKLKNKMYPKLENSETCTSCNLCVTACPIDAVTLQQ